MKSYAYVRNHTQCQNLIRIMTLLYGGGIWNVAYSISNRYHSRFFDCLAHPNLSATLATDQKSSYLLPKFSRVPLTIVLIPLISTIVTGTLLNFGKKYGFPEIQRQLKGHFW